MKVQYVAYDGKIFDDEVKCRAYETEKILMGNFSGGIASNFEQDACFVYIPDDKTLKIFQEIFGENPDARNITTVGFYIWDAYNYEYIRIDLNTFKTLRNFLREYCN